MKDAGDPGIFFLIKENAKQETVSSFSGFQMDSLIEKRPDKNSR